MLGLREKKKLDRLKRIEESALKLFDQTGYEAATMEKIAEAAELGVGTLYNYYSSKSDLLLGIISKRAVTYENEINRIIENKSGNILETLNACYASYLECFSFYSKRIWREFTMTVLAKGLPLFEMIRNIDSVFIKSITCLIENYQKEGIIKNGVSAKSASETLYSILFYHVMFYISSTPMKMSDLKKKVKDQTETVIKGLI